jgi:hypothetical protein
MTARQRARAYDMWANRGCNDREVAEALGWSNTKCFDIRTNVFHLPAAKTWGKDKKGQ